jgi:hypothetical protein
MGWRATLLLLLSACVVASEQPATVTFTIDFPGANPSHYEIVVGDDTEGTYRSNGQLDSQSEPGDPEALKFSVSPKVSEQIFDLAKRAKYFSGKVDSGHKNIANTGTKTLAYKDAQRNSSASYNYSSLQPVQQLTGVFQALSTTLEFGRRLSYFHKYEKLALEADLKRMEELQKEGSLGDVSAISALLNDIANDQSVMNVSRARARRLLATINK